MSDDPETKDRFPRPRFRALRPDTQRPEDTEALVTRVLDAAAQLGIAVGTVERQWNPLVARPQPLYWGRLS